MLLDLHFSADQKNSGESHKKTPGETTSEEEASKEKNEKKEKKEKMIIFSTQQR